MTPLETVAGRYTLPFQPYPYQVEVINDLAPLDRQGHYLDVGTGKTLTSTVCALYKLQGEGRKTIVLVPPILMVMWKRWLEKIGGITVQVYSGTPAKRKEIVFHADFIVMSIHIFKRDWDSIVDRCVGNIWNLVIDESQAIKNIASDNHKAMHAFVTNLDASLMLLTGTPLTTPVDGYAYIKMIAPGTYRNLNHFENYHVASRDFFKKINGWRHLDELAENMKKNAKRILKMDVLHNLPEVTITQLPYQLEPGHYALYKKLATEELLELEGGGKIDATSVSALYHNLSQIIVNYGHFAEDETKVAAGVELVEEILEELGPSGKLVVFANYRLSNRLLVEKLSSYNPVAVFGDVSQSQQNKNVDKFIDDESCRVFIGQPQSAGYGLDRLQHVCSNMIFLEPPQTPSQLEQCIARLHRNGQRNGVHVRMAVADGTVQVRQIQALLDKESLIAKVIRTPEMLRASLGL
jgi:SNF2 family DNA or RNA helicase